jgi:hypothetical protein
MSHQVQQVRLHREVRQYEALVALAAEGWVEE